jgi:hypothetical protein
VSKPVLLGVGLLLLVIGLVVWSSMGLQEYRRVCRTASGATRESAQRQAQDNACALLTSGVTGSISCGQTKPDSVRWMD